MRLNFLRTPLTFEVLESMGFKIYDHFPGMDSANQDATIELRDKEGRRRFTIKLLRNITSRHAWALDWEHNMGHIVFQYKDELSPIIKVFKTLTMDNITKTI